ncbi:MAG TPA: urease accessory UreF family protein [Nitrososphaera sp.]|nr:urease accessory UreF family protein [Nitrososphaera sp.]
MNTSHELKLMQLADSFFPSGLYGSSGGLESLVKSRRVNDKEGVLEFIRRQIRFQLAPCDCAVLLSLINAASKNNIDEAVEADNTYYSMKLVREVRTASTRSGRQILNCIVHISSSKFARQFRCKIESGEAAGTQPACLGIACYALGIPKRSAVRMLVYSYAVGVAGSALRLGLIQHLEAQEILTKLASDIDALKLKDRIGSVWQLSPLIDVLQMQHERDEQRMFIT